MTFTLCLFNLAALNPLPLADKEHFLSLCADRCIESVSKLPAPLMIMGRFATFCALYCFHFCFLTRTMPQAPAPASCGERLISCDPPPTSPAILILTQTHTHIQIMYRHLTGCDVFMCTNTIPRLLSSWQLTYSARFFLVFAHFLLSHVAFSSSST